MDEFDREKLIGRLYLSLTDQVERNTALDLELYQERRKVGALVNFIDKVISEANGLSENPAKGFKFQIVPFIQSWAKSRETLFEHFQIKQ